MSLAERIKTIRQSVGMTQAEFARAIGVHRSAIGQWENGFTKTLRADTALAMERASGYSSAWIVTGKGPRMTGALPLQGDSADKIDRMYAMLQQLPEAHRAKIEAEIDFLLSLKKPE